MKNFTNNFKQFTLRLSARWLIMALMLLLGTSSAWAAKVYFLNNKSWTDIKIYYWGGTAESIGWDASKSMTSTGDKINGYDVYSYDFGDKAPGNIIFRGSGKQTVDITYSANTCWQLGTESGGKYSVSVVTYTPSQSATFSFSLPNELYVGTPADIAYTLSPNAAGTVSFSCTTNNATINGTQITANSTGTVTVKATISYNNGYTGTTSTSKSTTAYIPVGTVLYLKPGTNWKQANARFALYLFNGTSNTWVSATSVCNNDGYYQAIVPDGTWETIIWCRMNPSVSNNCFDGCRWNQTGNLKYDGTKNLFTVADDTWDNATTTWSAWTPEPCCNFVAEPTITLVSSPVKCGVNVAEGFITIDGYDDSKYTYTLNKNGNATTIAYGDDGYAITEAGSYTVTADVSENSCGAQTSEPQEVTVTDNTHTINSFTVTAASDNVCKGSSVTLTATDINGATYAWYKGTSETPINGATSYTYSPTITENTTFKVVVTKTNNGCPATADATSTIQVIELPAAPTLNSNSTTVCSGVEFTLPGDYNWYEVSTGGTKLNSATISGGITSNKSYWAEAKNASGCVSEDRAQYTVTVNPTPTITGKSVTQPNTEITLTSIQGVTWSVSPTENVILTNNGDGTATFSASVIGEFVVSATNGTCSDTHVVNVADAFYVYMRQPKKDENAYNNFYYPTENPTQGGDLFYKEYASIPPAEGYTDYNTGGVAHDIIFTDCDGYVWYGFKASDKLVDGTNYFTVHAPNEGGIGGYYTHTYLTKPGAMKSDIYYTMNENASGISRGWYITKVSAPYSGPVVRTLGSTTLGTDEFAALYVTDCSGKEITGYQWYKDGQPYSSVCSYVGKKGEENSNAGETNNIRPTVAGYYSCTVTYEGGTTATSAAVPVTGTYSRSFTSTIPVLVVNTGAEDFPGCQASGTNNYPSKYADDLKAKRSVDVKIYDGEGALVYDRKARMAYRGSSSLNFTKKSYAFCPGKANCGDEDKGADYVKTEKLNMLGVGNAVDKDWVLYAAAADPSLMRNRMVFDTYQAMRNDWGVHSRYVELIVNGDYKGVYVFMDKITMNENRVEVNEDNGFIVKFDKTDCADRVGGYGGIIGDEKTFSTERTGRYGISTYHTTVDQLFEIEYPEKDDYPTGWASKVATIKGMFQAFEDALEAGDYATVQKYIDYDSWADWFIINEFTKNLDAYRASCIFVYTGEAGAKIEARPLWDQELSFNNAAANISGKGANSTSGLLIQNDGVYTDCFPAPFWFTGQLATFGTCGVNNGSGEKGEKLANCLLNDPCFVQVVKEKWNQHQFGALSAEKLNALVTKYTNELGDAALERESSKWPNDFRTSADCNAGDTGYKSVSYSDSKTAITSWIADGAGGRREGLTTAINGLTGTSFSIQIIPSGQTVTPWEPANISIAVTPAGYDYKLEYTGDNNLGGVVNTIIEKEGNSISYRIPRPKSWGTGDETTDGKREDVVYGIKATLNVAEGNMECGSSAAPYSEAEITLTDEDNENCPQ